MASEMAMCIPEVNSGVGNPIDGYEVIRHEIGHWLDSINEDGINIKRYDGLLPGWNSQEIEQFKALRATEKMRLQQGGSVLRGYALEDDHEFLSVLIEAYFEKGQDLSQRSPGLYKLMDEYFTHPKSTRVYTQAPSAFAITLSSLLLLVALPNGAFMLLRLQDKKKVENKSSQPESSGSLEHQPK
jgi:Mlc titration factor MtfA (ptsG expression regulator)